MRVIPIGPKQWLMDREALAQYTYRSVHTIRARCAIHSYDEIGRALYDVGAAIEILDKTRHRGPNRQKAA
jgi:hypothetical protein